MPAVPAGQTVEQADSNEQDDSPAIEGRPSRSIIIVSARTTAAMTQPQGNSKGQDKKGQNRR